MGGSVNESSHGGSAAGSASQASRADNGNAAKMESGNASNNVWLGIYGVLYTVSKERETSWIFFSIKYTLDFVQLFLLIFNPTYGWQVNTHTKMWKFMQILQVQPFMTEIGYTPFIALMYIFAALLLMNVAICVWTFHSFQNNSFGSVWPIQFLRVFGYIFYQVLDIMSLSLFLTATDCQYWGVPSTMQYYNAEFIHVYCWSFPHIIHFTVACVSLVIFLFLAGMFIAAEMQLNPLTTNKDANAHSFVELSGFAIKALMTLSQDFLTYKLLAIVWFSGTAIMAYLYWKWEPMVVEWVNYLRTGTYFSICYCSILFMMLQFPPASVTTLMHGPAGHQAFKDWANTLQLCLIGMLPAFGLGALASFLRLRYFRVTILNRFRTAPMKAKTRNIYQFTDAREVEILSRCCRKWSSKDTLDAVAVALAERVIKAGLQQLPNEPFMVIWYSSFLIDVQGSYKSGFAQLQIAAKMDVSYLDSFAIFSREQEHTQKASGGGRAGGAVDLVTFVEFQKNYRLALNAHREALLALRYFWHLLLHAEVRFEELSKAVGRIDRAVSAAEIVYKAVLQRHSNSARILRMYAKFLERVKHDPWNASRWTLEAEKLEQQEEDARHDNLLGMEEGGGTGDIEPGQRVALFSIGPHGEERAVVVFNSHGLILMANSAMRDMFGFSKAEIKGKNITAIMPAPFSEQHQQTLKSFVLTGQGSVVSATSEFAAIHKEQYMFAAKITIVRISGVGEDSTFLAALEVVPQDENVATVWVLPSGRVLSVDHTFTSWFGYSPADLEGNVASTLVASQAKQLELSLKQAKFSMIRLSHVAQAAAAAKAVESQGDPFSAAIASQKQMTSSRTMVHTSARLRVTDAVTDALELAAAPTLAAAAAAEEDAAFQNVWMLRDVHVKHKFTDAASVEITISNRGGAVSSSFCLHVLSLRRSGTAGTEPLPHMLVTGSGGAVLHVTDGLATALGSTPKALMANGSSSAMEAMMVQPFALLHRSGPGRGGQPLPPGPPPSYSCRSGLSVLLPDAEGGALPFRLSMKRRQGLDEMYNVCTLQQRTWEQALDERSLRMVVDAMGVVRQVGASPVSLFDFPPHLLLGRSAASCIDVLRSTDTGESIRALLAELAARLDDTPGMSWRVGVGWQTQTSAEPEAAVAPQQDDLSAAMPAPPPPSAGTPQAPSHPAIMTVAVHLPPQYVPPTYVAPAFYSGPACDAPPDFNAEDEDAELAAEVAADAAAAANAAFTAEFGPCLLLRLWRADLVTDVVEVDTNGIIVEAEPYLQKLYPAGLALGASPARMLGHHIRNFVPLGHGRRYMDLFEDNMFPSVPLPGGQMAQQMMASAAPAAVVKSSLWRHAGAPRPTAPAALLQGRHRGDGRELQLAVQIVRKGNAGAYLVVRAHNPCVGHPSLQDFLAQRRRRFSTASNATSALHHLGSQELTEEMIQVARESGYYNSGYVTAGNSGIGCVPAGNSGITRHASMELAMPTVLTTARHSCVSVAVDDPSMRGVHFNGAGSSSLGPELSAFLPSSRQPAELQVDEDDDSDAGPDDGVDRVAGDSEDGDNPEIGPDTGMSLQDAAVPAVPSVVASFLAAANNKDGGAGGGGARSGGRLGSGRHGGGGGGGSDASGADDVGLDTEDADYRRGQRHKKLLRILESEEVQKQTARFQWHTMGLLALLTVVGAVIFAITYSQINQQIAYVNNLYNIGQAARKMMRVATTTVDLCGMYHRYPQWGLQPNLLSYANNKADLKTMTGFYTSGIATFSLNHQATFMGFSRSGHLPSAFGLRELWETPSLIEHDFLAVPNPVANSTTYKVIINTNLVSLHDLGNAVITRAQDVLANGLVHNSTLGTHDTWGAWVSILYIINNTDSTLLSAYEVTLNSYAQLVIRAAEGVNRVQSLILGLEGVFLALMCLVYMWWLASRVDATRFCVYSVFTVVPQGLIRSLASQRLNLAEDGESEEDDENETGLNKLKNELVAGSTHGGGGAGSSGGGAAKANGGGGGGGGGGGKGERMGMLARSASTRADAVATAAGGVLSKLLFWRQPGKAAPSAQRNRLKRSVFRGVLALTWPFIAWGSVIVLLNALGYAKLSSVSADIMTFNVVSFLQLYSWRVTYGISLMSYDFGYGPPNATRMTQLRSDLVTRLDLMKKEYTLLLYGHSALPLETTPHFALVTNGIATTAGYGQDMLYNWSKCMATTKTGCLPSTDRAYQYIMHGMDTLTRQFFDVAQTITAATGLVPDNSGPELTFMWSTRDSMLGAATSLVSGYKTHVTDVYLSTRKLQLWAFILTMVLVVAYWFFVRRPFLRQVCAETRRITELLTQLPMEVDVERLLQRALVSGGTALPPGGKPKDRDSTHNNGGGGAGAGSTGGGLDSMMHGQSGMLAPMSPAWLGSPGSRTALLGPGKNKVVPDGQTSGAFSRNSAEAVGKGASSSSSGDAGPAFTSSAPHRAVLDSARQLGGGGTELMPRASLPPAASHDGGGGGGTSRQQSLSWMPLLQADEPGSPLQSPRAGSPLLGGISRRGSLAPAVQEANGGSFSRRASLGPGQGGSIARRVSVGPLPEVVL